MAVDFPTTTLPAGAEAIRAAVRDFLAVERQAGTFVPESKIGMGFSAAFSRRCGDAGYIGMTWPRRYGGGERSSLERYVVTEEMLAAGAPVRGHWTSDRQSGPVILRYGSDEQRDKYLRPISEGRCFFCIGLSEPDSGSDLASVKSRAERSGDSWLINGAKLWTTNAHNAHYMIALLRTLPQGEDRYHGLSQFIIDLAAPGVTVRPVINMAGAHDYNEVAFDSVRVDDGALLGTLHEGWRQVSAELAYERSGPERWLSTFRLLAYLNAVFRDRLDVTQKEALGALFGRLITLRQMSLSVAAALEAGKTPNLEASIVKDLGTVFEGDVVAVARDISASLRESGDDGTPAFRSLLDSATLNAPLFTIRGGTTEILRGTIARGLGLR